jgi:hypothetical protein
MTEEDAALSANLEFYRAFTTQNFAAMEALWARKAAVSCIHPGWAPLRDRGAVMKSWHDIMGNAEAPRIMCHDEAVSVYGDIAVVTCEEEIATNILIATNIFAKEDGAWRMIHHQAGPLVMRQDQHRSPKPGRIN